MAQLSKNTFSIELQKSFAGYYDPEKDWNGWDCPHFEWNEAVEIANWINQMSDKDQLLVDFERKIIIDVEDTDDPFDIDGVETETEDGVKTLYSVGTGWWIWQADDYYSK